MFNAAFVRGEFIIRVFSTIKSIVADSPTISISVMDVNSTINTNPLDGEDSSSVPDGNSVFLSSSLSRRRQTLKMNFQLTCRFFSSFRKYSIIGDGECRRKRMLS